MNVSEEQLKSLGITIQQALDSHKDIDPVFVAGAFLSACAATIYLSAPTLAQADELIRRTVQMARVKVMQKMEE